MKKLFLILGVCAFLFAGCQIKNTTTGKQVYPRIQSAMMQDRPTKRPALPEHSPMDGEPIRFADPVMEYVFMCQLAGEEIRNEYLAQHSAGYANSAESEEVFWKRADDYLAYLRERGISVSRETLEQVSSLWIYRISDNYAVDMHFHDAQLEDLYGGYAVVSLPLFVQINSLDDFLALTSVEDLALDPSNAMDLSPLSGLTTLKVLGLNCASVVDLEPLGQLKGLERLVISHARAPELAFLANLDMLQAFELLASTDVDLDKLVQYAPQLTTLSLYDCGVTKITPLGSLSQLRSLSVYHNLVDDVSPLKSLTGLEGLNLNNNCIEDITPLAGLVNLLELDLSENQIRDTSALAGMRKLEYLDLSWNQIEDCSLFYRMDFEYGGHIRGNPGAED